MTETVLDMRGAKCPWPVLKAKKRLAELREGEVLALLATDPMAQIDVPHFCAEAGHRLIEATNSEGVWRFRITKGPARPLPQP